MKNLCFVLVCCCLGVIAKAQTAASYNFTRSSGAYTSITGGPGTMVTTTFAGDDQTLMSIPLGFTFFYCGTPYTTLSACSNGWLSLANASTTSFTNSAASIPSAGVLMPYWDDLNGTGSTAYYQTSGTAPNRVFTLQYGNPAGTMWSIYTSPATSATWQVKLYEATGDVQFVYGNSTYSGNTTTIGISNSTTDWQTLGSAAATSASSTVFTIAIAGSPAAGSILTWSSSSPVSPISGPTSVCVGSVITLSDATAGGTWSSSATGIATVGLATGIVTGVSAGTATITYTTGAGSTTMIVTVNGAAAAIWGPTGVCMGATITLTDATPGGAWSSSATGIATIGSTGVVTPVSAGTATITYSDLCGGYATTTVTINAVPPAISGGSSVCQGSTLALTDATAGGTWSSSDTSIATAGLSTGVVMGIAFGVVTITYMSGTCSVTSLVTVNSLPTVSASAAPAFICAGGTSTLTATASASGPVYSVSSIPYILSTITTSLGSVSGDDVNSGAVALPFTFNFYGSHYTSVRICTNGWVSFTSPGTGLTNYVIPSASAESEIGAGIAMGMCDMNTAGGGTITYGYTGTAPNRLFIIYYNGVADYGGGTISGQIILHEGTNAVDEMVTSRVYGSHLWTLGVQGAVATDGIAPSGRNATSASVSTPEGWTYEPSGTVAYVWSPATYLSSTTASSTISIGATSTTTYTVTVTSGGCPAIATTTVTVNTVPTISTTTTSNCGGIYDLSANGAGAGGSYIWTPSAGLSCSSCAATVAAVASGVTYTVTGTTPAGCSNTALASVNGNRISGFVSLATAPTDTLKVWLVQFNPIDSSLTAEDSAYTCMDGGTPYYEFDVVPAGNYLVKAKLLSSVAGTSGYVPTYGLSSAHWDTAATITHVSATDTQHINMIYGLVPSGSGFIGGLISSGAGRGTAGDVPAVGMLVYLEDTVNNVLTYTYTDVTGAYSFAGLGNGSYIVYPEDYKYYTTHSAIITLSASSDSTTGVNFKQHTTFGTITPFGATTHNSAVSSEGVKIFPNPAANELTIQTEKGIYSSFSITNSIGQEMMQQSLVSTQTKVNISSLATGVYYITLRGVNGTKVQKFVKL